jgi:hypothetical protein
MDVFDIDFEALSIGELYVLLEYIEGELKRRNFPASGRSHMGPDKQIARIAFELRINSLTLRKLAREFKPARTGRRTDPDADATLGRAAAAFDLEQGDDPS